MLITLSSTSNAIEIVPECSCNCDTIVEGTVQYSNQTVPIFLELNQTESVSISTCDSDFDTFIHLHRADTDLEYQSIGFYDENICGPSSADDYRFNEEVHEELEEGLYRFDIGPVSAADLGAARVVVTLTTCPEDEDEGEWDLEEEYFEDADNWVYPVVISVVVVGSMCIGFFGVIYCCDHLCGDGDGRQRASTDDEDEHGGGHSTSESSHSEFSINDWTPLVGRWVAVRWSGSAKPGGDPDPEQDEAIIVVRRRSLSAVKVSFPNRGDGEEMRFTMKSAVCAQATNGPTETFEMNYEKEAGELVFVFGYRQEGTIVYKRQSHDSDDSDD